MDIAKIRASASAVDPAFAACAAALAAIGDATLAAEVNVTAIHDEEGVISLHLADSLHAASLIARLGADSVLDVGSGGGFPALPIAAALPDLCVSALDATAKKCRHIERTAESAGLSNVTVIAGRAEEKRELFASFDCVISRAVAALPELLELTAPLCRVGGHVLAMKGGRADEEITAAERAADILGLVPSEVVRYTLPSGGDHRCIAVYEKTRPTPAAYPREWRLIKKKPL